MVEKEKGTLIPHHEAVRNSSLQNEGRSLHQGEMRTFLHQEGDEGRSPTLSQSRGWRGTSRDTHFFMIQTIERD